MQTLPQQIQQQWYSAKEQVSNNPRLQLMLYAVLAIVLLSLVFNVQDARVEQVQQVQKQQKILAKLTALQQENQWPEYLKQEQLVNQQLQKMLWQAKTAELATADLQNFLNAQVKSHQVKFPRLKTNPAQTINDIETEIWQVQAELNGVMPADELTKLLLDLAKHPQKIIIEQFSYTPQRGNRLFLLVSAYFSPREFDPEVIFVPEKQ